MSKSQASRTAREAMKSGNNCCQSVLLAAKKVWDLPIGEDMLAAASLFAEGMSSGCTCGALTGMVMAAGIMDKSHPHPAGSKLPQQLHNQFKQEFGSTCCRVIRKKRTPIEKIGNKGCIDLTSRTAEILFAQWEASQPDLPLISIVIPTLNEENNIAVLLASLAILDGVELIVCDGGSSDSTLQICRSFPVQVLCSPRGRGIQLNMGARNAQGEILLFLHADSRIESRVLDDIRQSVTQGYPWGCCTLEFSEKTRAFRTIAFFSNLRSRAFSSCYGDQGIFCQRDLFWSQGGFPEIMFLEDLEFSHLLRRQQKARVIDGRIMTSTRRFRSAGIGKTIGKMQIVKLFYGLGMKPEILWKWYKSDGQGKKCELQ